MIATSFPIGGGTPTHSAKRGTPYFDVTNNKLFVNNDVTNWREIGGSGGGITLAQALVNCFHARIARVSSSQLGIELVNGIYVEVGVRWH